jgi:hypothetical protein
VSTAGTNQGVFTKFIIAIKAVSEVLFPQNVGDPLRDFMLFAVANGESGMMNDVRGSLFFREPDLRMGERAQQEQTDPLAFHRNLPWFL